MQQLLFWVGVAAVLGLAVSIITTAVTLMIARRIEPNDKLQSEVRSLSNDFDDLVDHINRKETRDRVRKMRDGKAAKDAQPDPDAEPLRGTPEHKAWLRRRAARLTSA